MQALTEREAAEGLVATFDLFKATLDDLRVAGDGLVVVLDRLQDPGNLGTLIRTADAVGATGVVLVEPCVDPFDPKVVRGSMGSLFHVPLVRTGDVAGLFTTLHDRGLRVVAADAQRGVDWGDGLWHDGVALVLGNEARGLSADLRPHVDAWVRLPIAGRAESLNVAVAGGVLMYAWLRQQVAAT
jgi:TrmH family RNA methyltransferase